LWEKLDKAVDTFTDVWNLQINFIGTREENYYEK
tara:strand:- start:2463 stop:2564 length:102 start_codon:yes stop_codon:yes gene_type:complete